MMTEKEAIELVNNELVESGNEKKQIADICPENFGWIFLLQFIFPPKNTVCGGIGAYLVDKKTGMIHPFSHAGIEHCIKKYQRANGYPREIQSSKIYNKIPGFLDFSHFPDMTFIEKIKHEKAKLKYRISRWLDSF